MVEETASSARGGTPTSGDWHKDPDINRIQGYLEQGELPDATQRQLLPQPVKRLLNHWRRLELVEGVVCRRVQDSSTLETLKQIVIPDSEIHALLEVCHKQAGHPGTERMLALLRRNTQRTTRS